MMMIITIDNYVTITVRITTRVGSYDLCILRLKPWEGGPRPPPLLFAPDTAAWPSHEIAVIRWPCFFQRNPILSKLCQSDTWPVVLQSRSLGSEPEWLSAKKNAAQIPCQPCLTCLTCCDMLWQWPPASRLDSSGHEPQITWTSVLVDCRNHSKHLQTKLSMFSDSSMFQIFRYV